jgi:uncharacterized DUF497 family protein
VFDDPLAAIFADAEHSVREWRELIVGHSVLNRISIVCFTEHAAGTVRIISARKVTIHQRRDYETHIKAGSESG